jgi:hypothetical protein
LAAKTVAKGARNQGFAISLPLAIITRIPETNLAFTIVPSFINNRSPRKVLFVVAGGAVVALAFIFAVVSMIGRSEPVPQAMQRVQNDPAILDNLGAPVKRGMFVSGSVSTTGPSGHADLAIPLSGPKGKGTLYVVADESADLWNFQRLELAMDGRSARINLLPSPAAR